MATKKDKVELEVNNMRITKSVYEDVTGWLLEIDFFEEDKWRKTETIWFENSASLKGYVSSLNMD